MKTHLEAIDHPLEELLDIESCTTLTEVVDDRNTELVATFDMDDKDKEIDSQIQEVYDTAMSAFDQQALAAEKVEPKFRARSQEVAVQFLTVALNAAREKSLIKQHKDKLVVSRNKQGPRTLNQNLIVADRNDILKQILGQKSTDEE